LRLSALIDGSDIAVARCAGDVDILGLAADSRDCGRDFLFAALPGTRTDGSRFIADAVERGAACVLTTPDTAADAVSQDVNVLVSDNPRRALSVLAARFFGAMPERAVAVTGTNGKTSVAVFCAQLWRSMGTKSAAIGTLGVFGNGYRAGLIHTTPEPVTLHRVLADLAVRDFRRVALEASSHGLDQHRLDGIRFAAAGFTNLTQDHYDYHPTIEAYRAAKYSLFDLVEPGGTAAINADSAEFGSLAAICRERGLRVIGFGRTAAELKLVEARHRDGVQMLGVEAEGRRVDTVLPLPGRFQAMNALCAAAMVAGAEDISIAEVLEHLPKLSGVRGRLENVARHPKGGPIFVDYAHTPDALETVLAEVRPSVAGRLFVVFGCGGDRDRDKRARMGAIAAHLADRVFVTDDNPRGEDAAEIRAEIMVGCPDASNVGGRAEAIRAAVAEMAEGDVLVVAGKGHEQGQIVGDRVLPFDDGEQVRRAVDDLGRAA
jgi:UDP-N-acetylmuramoyl-L-alanyl-D-glutamate--2,6-diaminopimelate ligase